MGRLDTSRGLSPAWLCWSSDHLEQCGPGHGPKSGSRQGCLIIACTRQQGSVLYKRDKGVNDAVCLPEFGPAEVRDLTVSSLPLFDSARQRQRQQHFNAVGLTAWDTDLSKCLQEQKAFNMQDWSQIRVGKVGGVYWLSVDGLNDCKSAGHEKNRVWKIMTQDLNLFEK